LWARTQSTTARKWRRSAYQAADIFQPDAQFVNAQDGNVTEYGRLHIQFLSDGSAVHNMQPAQGSVTDDEVILNIRLTFVDAFTLYAVRRFKIESYQTDVTTRLTPLQPSFRRSNPVFDGFFVGKAKPLDFSCTEFDLSSIPNGAKSERSPFFIQIHLQERARSCLLSLPAASMRIPLSWWTITLTSTIFIDLRPQPRRCAHLVQKFFLAVHGIRSAAIITFRVFIVSIPTPALFTTFHLS
jgi:hypothetical protein